MARDQDSALCNTELLDFTKVNGSMTIEMDVAWNAIVMAIGMKANLKTTNLTAKAFTLG